LANLGFTASRERPSAEEMAKGSRARSRFGLARSDDEDVYSLGPAPARAVSEPLADALVADLCALITRAERAGLRPARAARWRALVRSQGASRETLLRCERRLRLWIHAPKLRDLP
jgi:hypothetical protein